MYYREIEVSRIYKCPKCEKQMGNDLDTIKKHNNKFCKPKVKKTKNGKKTL